MELREYPRALRQALSEAELRAERGEPDDRAMLLRAARVSEGVDDSWFDGPSPPLPHNPGGTQMVWWR